MRLTVGVLVAIVVGLEKPTLLAQSDIYIPKCTEGGTVGENRNFWLLKTSLIFQVISWELDVNLSKNILMKILAQIKRYFKFVLSVI